MTWKGNSQKHSMASRGIKLSDFDKPLNFNIQKYGEHPDLYMYNGYPVLINLNKQNGGHIELFVKENERGSIVIFVSRKSIFDKNTPYRINFSWTKYGLEDNIENTEQFAKALNCAIDLAKKVENFVN